MTLMDAQPVDQVRLRRRRLLLISALVIAVLAISLYLYWPYYRARQTVNQFMNALIRHNYQEAYYLWQADPKLYPMNTFMRDWGPQSEWGYIRSYKIEAVTVPPGGHASGLVVLVKINGIPHEEKIWVENHSEAMSYYEF